MGIRNAKRYKDITEKLNGFFASVFSAVHIGYTCFNLLFSGNKSEVLSETEASEEEMLEQTDDLKCNPRPPSKNM